MPFKLRKVRLSFAFRMFVLNSVFVMSLKKVSWCKTLSVWNMMFYWEFFTSSHIVLPLTCSHFSWSQYFHWFLKGKVISCTVIFLSRIVQYRRTVQPQIISETLIKFWIGFIGVGLTPSTVHFQHVPACADILLSMGRGQQQKRKELHWNGFKDSLKQLSNFFSAQFLPETPLEPKCWECY